MLSSETKQKINNCRDYLVGKIPDPKGQIEQITNALIYKFMSDQDKLSQDLGGQASFFIGEYEEYNWPKLFDSTKTNEEKANLYIKGIEKLSRAKHLPELFRQIFKDAYIPFRAPNTIVHFINEINKFDYHHSEELGNAFEYLLSIMGSQGNAGQFRTPRHIIEFVVDVVDPKPEDTIYDPACGTAGFLISAYKHIIESNPKLTPSQRLQLSKNISGVDIDPGMAKIARVNLFLHDFKSPHISEDDTLSNKDLWGKKFDVILANPPFMTPKGGIHPHDGYTINSTKAEVLFTSYIAQHLKLGGRAGIIVPEGIIFQAATAYKKLRRMLIEENLLYGVISLPGGIFQPYSGVKTSVLLLDRNLAAKTDKILFAKIEHDGFTMSTQRKEHDKNELPAILSEIQNYKTSLENGEEFVTENLNVFAVEKSKIAEDEEFNLSAERYRDISILNSNYPLIELGEILEYEQPTKYIVADTNYDDEYKTPVLTAGKSFILGYTNESENIFPSEKLPVIIFDDFTTATKYVDFPFKVKSSAMKILHCDTSKAYPLFMYHVMQKIDFPFKDHKRYWISQYSKIQIPLPPLDIQKQIVDELDSYQKIIDGAKQIVENYKPTIKIDESWEMVELGDIATKVEYGIGEAAKDIGELRYVRITDIDDFYQLDNESKKYINVTSESEKYILKKGDVLIARTGATYGKSLYFDSDELSAFAGYLIRVNFKQELDSKFFSYFAQSHDYWNQARNLVSGGGQPQFNANAIKKIKIPLPPIKTQKEIVAEIEREQSYVDGAKELIKIYEKKIEQKVSEIWGEESLD